MKIFLTLTFLLFFGVTAIAQNVNGNKKVASIEIGIVLTNKVKVGDKIRFTEENKITRVYKLKNTRVRKALIFETEAVSKIA